MMIQSALKWAPKTTMKIENSHSRGPEPVAAEQHQPEEAALEEEGEHAFGREQAAEHVADEARVVGPVHPELELLDDAGGHADGEDQAVDLDPEERQLAPLRVLGPDVDDADDHEHQPEPHRQGREDEVEAGGQRELDAREGLSVHAQPCPCGVPALGAWRGRCRPQAHRASSGRSRIASMIPPGRSDAPRARSSRSGARRRSRRPCRRGSTRGRTAGRASRVGLELLVRAVDGPAAVLRRRSQIETSRSAMSSATSRSRTSLPEPVGYSTREVVAHERIPVPERHDDQVVHRHPDRSAPVRVPAEQSGRRLARLVVDLRGQPAELELERARRGGAATARAARAATGTRPPTASRRAERPRRVGGTTLSWRSRGPVDRSRTRLRGGGRRVTCSASMKLANRFPSACPRADDLRPGSTAAGRSGISPTIEWTLIGTVDPSASLRAS